MIKDLLIIAVSAALLNNVVLSQFLGLCSFIGVSTNTKTAAGMGGAVCFVITIASAVASLLYDYVLAPLGLDYMKTIVFILVIAALVLGTLSLLMLRGAILRMEQKTEELRQQAAVLEQENEKLEKSISQLGTVQSVTELAEQLLGLVDPNTVIFSPEG